MTRRGWVLLVLAASGCVGQGQVRDFAGQQTPVVRASGDSSSELEIIACGGGITVSELQQLMLTLETGGLAVASVDGGNAKLVINMCMMSVTH
jgi:hypothetical protein